MSDLLIICLVFFCALMSVFIPWGIYDGIKKRSARKKGQLIINGEINATVEEIDQIIKRIMFTFTWEREDLKEEEEFFLQQLRQKRKEKIL